MKNIRAIFVCFLFSVLSAFAQEDTALAKATARKIAGRWAQTEQSNIKGQKTPARATLTLNENRTYTWVRSAEKKNESGKWKTDNYSKMSNTGKMMELLVLQTKGRKSNSIFIQQLSDSTLMLRTYDYSKGAPAKDTFTDLHFKRLP